MQVQSLLYFVNQYGTRRAETVLHRMRTWYNQQARLAQREGHTSDAYRFSAYADHFTMLINCHKAEYKTGKAH